MNKKAKIFVGGIFVCFIVLIGSIMFLYNNGQKAVSANDEEVIVEISGNRAMVLNQLDEAGLLRNKLVANIYLRLHPHEFIANTYILNRNMDLQTIFTILEEADNAYILQTRFTIIEGITVPQVAQVVADTLEITQEEVLQKWADRDYLASLIEEFWFLDSSILHEEILFPLEGYLAAQTYIVKESEPTIESLTSVMLQQMDADLSPFRDAIAAFTINGNSLSIHEFLSLASIIQAESLLPEDHAKIAGVFVHRLEIGMRLQSDVTVNYANQETKIAVTIEDTFVESSYNTYRNHGIQIGPISNVTPAIIEALLHYDKTENLYFFHIVGGEAIFTPTYERHLEEIRNAREQGLWLQD